MTTLRPAGADDVDRLVSWHADPDVSRYWDDERGRERVTVDPYAWNEAGIRAWQRAGFVEVSRHEADADYTAPWILMEFRG